MPWVFNPFTGKLDQTGSGGGSATTDASLLTSGTLADARLSANVVTLTGTQTLTNKSISAAQLTGTIALARLDPLVAIDNIDNNFTAGQTITAPANTSALTASYSVTGANTTPLVNLTGTWNTTGIARGILLNVTDTASAATSALMDLGVGSRTQYAFTKSRQFWLYNSSPATQDASNFERGFMRWNANTLEIGTEAGGTGTQRQLSFPLGTATVSTPLSITQTFNATGVTFSALDINVRDTASAFGSFLQRWQTNSGGAATTIASLTKFGTFTTNSLSTNGLSITGANPITWTGGGQGLVFGTGGSILNEAINVIAFRNGVFSQALNVYGTFTSASVFERLKIAATSTRNQIISESTGGTVRPLEMSFFSSASDPATTDITSGAFGVWKNTGSGVVKLWVNDGGTMKSVTLA